MVSLSVVFHEYVHTLHVLIDKLAFKAKLSLSNDVGASPKWLTQLIILICLTLSLVFLWLVKGVSASFGGPLYKLDQFYSLLRGVISRHLFRKCTSYTFFHVSLGFVDQIDVVWVKPLLLFCEVEVEGAKLLIDKLPAIVHQVLIVFLHSDLVLLLRRQVLHVVLLHDVLRINDIVGVEMGETPVLWSLLVNTLLLRTNHLLLV